MQYRHEIAEAALNNLPIGVSDAEVIAAHVEYLLTRGPSPYVLRINHDARKAPCPVWRDWKKEDMSGATFTVESKARAWITEAMKLGFEVTRAQGKIATMFGHGSLTQIRLAIRSREAWAAKRAEATKRNGHRVRDLDDEIPF